LTACQLIGADLSESVVEGALVGKVYIHRLTGMPEPPRRLRIAAPADVLTGEAASRFFEQSSAFQPTARSASVRAIHEDAELTQKFVEARTEIERLQAENDEPGDLLETLGKLAGELERDPPDIEAVGALWRRLHNAAPTAAGILTGAVAVKQLLAKSIMPPS
jgi:hypothetical protein